MSQAKKILVVDDHPTNRLKLNMAVKKLGHEVEMAGGGADALQILQENPDIHLVLLDILMPDVDGHAVLQQMHRDSGVSSVPVVVVSSVTDDQEVVTCLEEGAVGFLSKDFKADDLFACIKQYAR